MSYRPIHEDTPPYRENFEMSTHYDPGATHSNANATNQNWVPPPGHPPPDHQSRHSRSFIKSEDEDVKVPLTMARSDSKKLPVDDWPVESQRVAEVTPLRAGIMLFDVILASTPIMFIALALTAARLDGKDVSDYGSKLQETLLLSPTIFPLIFAALMGRFFRHLGVWLAQRGTTLGRLEQLIGCQSVFSALERQICLRPLSVVGLLSVLVWLLSPVGGQAALRLLEQETHNISSTESLRYLDPQTIKNSQLGGASAMNSGRSGYTSIFLAALLSSSKYQNTPMDLWGNVKLPKYSKIENSTSDPWKEVKNSTDPWLYGSLIGIPVASVPSHGFSDFNIKARQFDITCSSNRKMSRNESQFGNLTSTWKIRPLSLGSGCDNTTAPSECILQNCTAYPCPVVSKSLASSDTGMSDNYPFSVAQCNVSFAYFEAAVRCNNTSCAVKKMRKLDLLRDGYTEDTDDVTRLLYFGNTMAYMTTVDNWNVGSSAVRGSTNMEKWINDPTNFIGTRYSSVSLYDLPPDIFAERLSILWNTFFQSTYAGISLGGSLPKNLTQTGLLYDTPYNITFNATETHILRPTPPIYKTNWKWLSSLLVCSFILLVAAYLGLVLKYLTLAPDIIGYASSLTQLNPYVPTPMGGTTLHGLERTALLHDLPIRIGDVCANDPVGAIAFAKNDGRVVGLNKRRLYI